MTAQQLKNSILQLAVQGKLVPQDPNDEPASVLLQRIKAEKQELIKAGKIKKDKKSSEIFRGASRNLPYTFCEQIGKEIKDISDEIPFDIPDSWEWARLLSVSYHVGDKSNQILAKEVVPEGIVPVVSQGKVLIDGYSNHLEKAIDLLPLVMFGDHTRNVKYIDFKFVISADGTKFHKVIIADSKYVYYWMQYVVVNLRDRGYARHYSLLTEQFLPLPPLSEQHRIVSKIEELLPFIEKYEQAETQLTTLNTTFPEMLKKSILQEAVQGKLVPQNPDDEPASVLLERIRAEKQKLIKAGKIKKSKHESVIITRDKIPYEIVDGKERCIADDVPFEIPDTWCWCRLGTISCYFDAGKSPSCIKQSVTGDEYGVITTTSIQLGYFNESQNKVLPPNFEVKEDMKVKKGDILITRAGPMNRTGVACVVKEIHYNLILSDKTIRINMPDEFFDKDYIVTVLNSPNIREQIIRLMSGMDKQQVNISQDKYKTVFIPLPPLEEQHRIVAKIEELMQYCDRLK